MPIEYIFPNELCQCANSHICHRNKEPFKDPHAVGCNCAVCIHDGYINELNKVHKPNYNPYTHKDDEYSKLTLCIACNLNDECYDNDDDDNNITRCIKLHKDENFDRMPNEDVPHAGSCNCDKCYSDECKAYAECIDPSTLYCYRNTDLCRECDTIP
jgi:hypothetical protein